MKNPAIINAASPTHHEMMKRLACFLNLDEIRYEDLGNGENYILVRQGKELVLKVRAFHDTGGFLAV